MDIAKEKEKENEIGEGKYMGFSTNPETTYLQKFRSYLSSFLSVNILG